MERDRCMPSASSDCSRKGRRRPSTLLLTLVGAALGVGAPVAVEARTGWLRGIFPVASFAGYTSPFGMRTHPLGGDLRPHYGLDIAAPLGSVVRSWWSGTVVEVISDGGCGNGLVIRSGPYEHLYCHLGGSTGGGVYRSGPVQLAVGQQVRAGQTIAHVGMTGSTTGPHLHWGIRYRGQWLDPARVLRAMAESRRRVDPNRTRLPKVGLFR